MTDNGQAKQIPSGWVYGTVKNMIAQLDGQWDDVCVGAVAVLGEQGYDFACCEESVMLDPAAYGPVMLQGLNMIAGAALGKAMGTYHAALMHEDHFTHEIEDDPERFAKTRQLYEQCVRLFLRSVMEYAGQQFQKQIRELGVSDKAANISLASGSQMLAMWVKVAESTLSFKAPEVKDEPENEDSERS